MGNLLSVVAILAVNHIFCRKLWIKLGVLDCKSCCNPYFFFLAICCVKIGRCVKPINLSFSVRYNLRIPVVWAIAPVFYVLSALICQIDDTFIKSCIHLSARTVTVTVIRSCAEIVSANNGGPDLPPFVSQCQHFQYPSSPFVRQHHPLPTQPPPPRLPFCVVRLVGICCIPPPLPEG